MIKCTWYRVDLYVTINEFCDNHNVIEVVPFTSQSVKMVLIFYTDA